MKGFVITCHLNRCSCKLKALFTAVACSRRVGYVITLRFSCLRLAPCTFIVAIGVTDIIHQAVVLIGIVGAFCHVLGALLACFFTGSALSIYETAKFTASVCLIGPFGTITAKILSSAGAGILTAATGTFCLITPLLGVGQRS